jgi:phosphoribosylanthranilate isomerase
MFVKICGITREADAAAAVECGASAIGFIFWPESRRYIQPSKARAIVRSLPAFVTPVGVFVNEPIDGIRAIAGKTGISAVQLHGDEPPAYADALPLPVIRAVSASEIDEACAAWSEETTLLVDNVDPVRRGGTGVAVDWSDVAAVTPRRRVVLAGGLSPQNVSEAIRVARPYGVDVSSGVEASPGVKDFDKVARFVANARRAFEEMK